MNNQYVELFNLGNGITVTRTDRNQLEATIVDGIHLCYPKIEPTNPQVLHAALDTINYLQSTQCKWERLCLELYSNKKNTDSYKSAANQIKGILDRRVNK